MWLSDTRFKAKKTNNAILEHGMASLDGGDGPLGPLQPEGGRLVYPRAGLGATLAQASSASAGMDGLAQWVLGADRARKPGLLRATADSTACPFFGRLSDR